jgi:hypothetical protein
VKVVWGAEGAPGTIPTFEAVIESVGIKYTMFDGNGRPLRAAVRLGLKQARRLKVAQPRQRVSASALPPAPRRRP